MASSSNTTTKSKQWAYRPTDAEHELILKALARSEYPSISQFVREAVLRMIYDDDRRPLFSDLSDTIDELQELKQKFLKLVVEGDR